MVEQLGDLADIPSHVAGRSAWLVGDTNGRDPCPRVEQLDHDSAVWRLRRRRARQLG